MRFFKVLALLLTLPASAIADDYCTSSVRHERDQVALEVVATAMKYTVEELCQHPRVMAIHFTDRIFYNPQNNNEPEPHVWMTVHYNEYSCQYFVRDLDLVVTRKNCYNTF